MTRPLGRAGFTLLELIVSLAITGAVVSAGYASFAVMLDRRERAVTMVDELSQASQQRALLRRLIESAHVPEQGAPAFAGLDAEHDGDPDDTVTLMTAGFTELASAQAVVQLGIDRDPETPERGLVLRAKAWPHGESRIVEVNRQATGFEVRYYSIPLGDRGWLPSWVSSTMLPTGIELRLFGDSLPPLLRLPILVPLGAGR